MDAPDVDASASDGTAAPRRWSAAPSSFGTGRSGGSVETSLAIPPILSVIARLALPSIISPLASRRPPSLGSPSRRSFHRSPRAGRRRSARTPVDHFTARLAPAAVARLALPSACLHQVLFGELGGLDADHRVAEILADLHQHRGILEVRGGLHDGLRALGRIRRLEDEIGRAHV